MPIVIEQFAQQHVEAVRLFNERLAAGGEAMQFLPSPVAAWLPKIAGRRLFQELYLAVDEAAAVHGGYILKHQDFWIRDHVRSIADFHLPISEGVVDKRYSQVGVQLLRDALQRQPLLFGLGIGGCHEPLVRLLAAAGWSLFCIPFFFRVIHPAAFLRNIAYLRRWAANRYVLDICAETGLGWLGIRALQAVAARTVSPDPALVVEPVDEFSTWADDLWQEHKGQYGMAAVRDAETLRILYPKEDARFIRLKIARRSRPIGWAVLLSTSLRNHNHFHNMRLGSIVDCLASVEDTTQVVRASREYLEGLGVDLIVSNQSHAAWQRGLRQAGFLQGPSNFVFTSSRELTRMLRQKNVQNDELHLNRGDGDGPNNL
jgi:hypothetical protein